MLKHALVVMLALVATAPVSVSAQVRYTDSEGVTHWVDSIDRVPDQYKRTVKGAPARSSRPTTTTTTTPQDWDRKAREAAQQLERDRADARKRDEYARAQRAWQEAVQACTIVSQDSKFDVAVSGKGKALMVGPEQEKAAFAKCMTERGQPAVRSRP
jgi:hypothetical protein